MRSALVKNGHRLSNLALTWESPEGMRVPRTVSDVIGDPAGLGPVLPDVPKPAVIKEALGDVNRQGRALLDALTWGPATGVLSEAVSKGDTAIGSAARSLIQQGLLHRVDASHVVLPRQVGLVLREGQLHQRPSLAASEVEAAEVDVDVVDATAGGRAAELLVHSAELIDLWGAEPAKVLRSGGLSVRDLGKLANHLEMPVDETAWLVEVMQHAGLIAREDTDDATWMPTGEADDWVDLPPAQRWADLAKAWWTMPAAPRSWDLARAVASTPSASTPLGQLDALDVGMFCTPCRLCRWAKPQRPMTSSNWSAGITPSGWPEPGRVAQRPVSMSCCAKPNGLACWGVEPSTAGRALVSGDFTQAGSAMATHIPEAVDYVLLQADLTAIAPGRLDGPARQVMRLLADVESRGGATVHRITESSLRRALDSGWTADRVMTELSAISRTGIPQPLEYLVRDISRRHGVARVGSCAAYVRSDDEALLDRLEADRGLNLLQFRRIAPTVVVTPVPATTVLDLLRERQYGPVAEGADGGITVASGRHHRTSRSARPSIAAAGVDAEVASQIVAVMRNGETARRAESETTCPPALTRSSLLRCCARPLRRGCPSGLAMWMMWAECSGRCSDRRMLRLAECVARSAIATSCARCCCTAYEVRVQLNSIHRSQSTCL
ncbi:helicase-associated domain-containing protein [Ornithinimicrobium sp. INDO-MA30-4]|uniref:helicase-associated domain-containing protein n=1 Tax=Ornithinimicrobium sp. INDO-MA30-4 TaxID=2908651 RepID=UPI001F213FA9|nr:helicase-associated domain-containing protein [Ornithinimicrobium sp. INDO-MA30-4]UJH69516.1 helicase-associated domain-containing protein [Ornithinimicrobium sp. INDO-MA30-4]